MATITLFSVSELSYEIHLDCVRVGILHRRGERWFAHRNSSIRESLNVTDSFNRSSAALHRTLASYFEADPIAASIDRACTDLLRDLGGD